MSVDELIKSKNLTPLEMLQHGDLIEECRAREKMLAVIEKETGKKIEELDKAWVEMCVQLNFLVYQLEKFQILSIPRDRFADA
jgi:hypothetical protein